MTFEHQKTNEILKWFEAINKTPRGSGNEAAIAQWLMDWAAENRFEAQEDKTGNVVVKVPAAPGCEKAPVVVIQGHMDMVCEKTPDSDHDFTKDPIPLVYDGEWVRADRTTLGADNAIAIAMGMTAALDKTLKRPALELFFTVDEETGLTGAFAVEPDFLEGRILLNIDSEVEGIFTIGCAGGQKSDHTLPLDAEPITDIDVPYTLAAGGMSGGHSADIHHEKANALKILARTLHAVLAEVPVRLAGARGGSADNAIPRDAEVIIVIPDGKADAVHDIMRKMETVFKAEFKNTDPELAMTLTPTGPRIPKEMVTLKRTKEIVECLLALPHGIWAMSTEVEHFVETSNNLASFDMKGRELEIVTSQRSPVPSRLDAVNQQIESVIRMAGGSSENRGRYPGWQANIASPLLGKCIAVYEKLYDKKPVVETTHGGLECGVIGDRIPGMDMISFGPTIKHPHSPEETMHVPAVGKVWDFMAALLETLK